MLTVEDYGRIRRAHRDRLSIRAIAKKFHHSRRKVREALQNSEPRKYTRQQAPPAPKLDPFKPIIDQILADDEQAPPKQRHTATQIFRRLDDRARLLGRLRPGPPLRGQSRSPAARDVHPPGPRPGQRVGGRLRPHPRRFPRGPPAGAGADRDLGYSNCPFAIALPTERTEAILHGLVEAFAFFGCVPQELWWDNPTTVAVQILAGPRAAAQRAVRGPGQPLQLRAAVLHAGPRATRSRTSRTG